MPCGRSKWRGSVKAKKGFWVQWLRRSRVQCPSGVQNGEGAEKGEGAIKAKKGFWVQWLRRSRVQCPPGVQSLRGSRVQRFNALRAFKS